MRTGSHCAATVFQALDRKMTPASWAAISARNPAPLRAERFPLRGTLCMRFRSTDAGGASSIALRQLVSWRRLRRGFADNDPRCRARPPSHASPEPRAARAYFKTDSKKGSLHMKDFIRLVADAGDRRHIVAAALCGMLSCLAPPGATAAAVPEPVLRATLDNGLRVVVVRNTLAPVVSTSVSYLVGADECPPGFPGIAHAQEHMMFRGSPGLSADQLADIGGLMGGSFNAETGQTVTQYYSRCPRRISTWRSTSRRCACATCWTASTTGIGNAGRSSRRWPRTSPVRPTSCSPGCVPRCSPEPATRTTAWARRLRSTRPRRPC